MLHRFYKGASALALYAVVCPFTSPAAHAQAITLRFNKLPSAQGWRYKSSGPTEASVFSLAKGKLLQNTVGKGVATMAYYEKTGFVSLNKPFTVTLRARVSSDEPNQIRTYGFSFGVQTPTKYFAFSIENGLIFDKKDISVRVDTSVFHTYRLDGDFSNGTCILFIDGIAVAVGTDTVGKSTNTIFIGDGTPTGGNANAEITRFSFVTQGASAPRTGKRRSHKHHAALSHR